MNEKNENTEDKQSTEVTDNRIVSALSYLSILALIPFLTNKEDQWVRQHAVQGMNLLIIEVIASLLSIVPFIGRIAGSIITLYAVIISIMGLVNVFNKEYKDLPFMNYFKFIK